MADEMEDEIDVEGFDEKEGSSSLLVKHVKEEAQFTDEYNNEKKTQIWDEFGVPVSDWSIGDIDQESRLTIESMLHEERLLQRELFPTMFYTINSSPLLVTNQYLKSNNGPATRRPKKKPSPYLRWTAHERQTFERGFLSYGNKWTQIARLIPTRTPLQVKNYARYYFPSKMDLPKVNCDIDNQNLILREAIHSHIPTSLNTGSPTVPTRLTSPTNPHIPLTSKRRHFKKFGFANLSSSRLLKLHSRKDLSPSKRPAQTKKLKRISTDGSATHKAPDKMGGSDQGVRTECRRKARPGQVDRHTDEAKVKMRDGTGGLLEQGGGVVRIGPEGSEDEDVDVEDDPVGAKHLDRSLIGLAATCDRIYNNLISPSDYRDQSTLPNPTPAQEKEHTSMKPLSRIATNAQERRLACTEIHTFPQNAHHHKFTQEVPLVRELAWNADHTYSMSIKTLQKLGIVMEVAQSEPQREDPTLSTSGRDSPRSSDADACSNKDTYEQKLVTTKAELVDPSSDSHAQYEKVLLHPSGRQECESGELSIKEEALDIDDTSALAETKFDTDEISKGKDDDVVSDTPLSNSAEAQPSHALNDDSVSELYTKMEVEGCDDERKVLMTTPEHSPGVPATEFKNECQIAGPDQDEGSRGDTDAELQTEGKDEDDLETVGDERCVDDCPDDSCNEGERPLELDKIDEWEKEELPEFFEGRPTKTPERYLKIRNYIYEHWVQTKPNYLSKSAIRTGLRNCGDVNSIGRVHHSLEVNRVINCQVENPHKAALVCRADTVRHRSTTDHSLIDLQTARRESMRTRKKRDLEASPIVPDKPEDKPASRKSVRTGPRKSKLVPYDPFKLIECSKFTEEKVAPFHVRIQSDAMVIMDVHSHMSSTEVIGLLGGTFLKDERTLDVLLAVPCNSISTGMQCEMDPVSQTEAYECILSRGYQVVGWYHSHPAFAANPSIRDIETQSDFQGWFSQGGAPFIGVIISPCHNYQIAQSKVCCLTISEEWFPELKCRRPYQFDFAVCHSHCDSGDTINTVSNLVTKFAVYQYRSEMLYLWSRHYDILFVDKMLKSVKTYLSPSQQEELIDPIKDLITAEFTLKSIPPAEDEEGD